MKLILDKLFMIFHKIKITHLRFLSLILVLGIFSLIAFFASVYFFEIRQIEAGEVPIKKYFDDLGAPTSLFGEGNSSHDKEKEKLEALILEASISDFEKQIFDFIDISSITDRIVMSIAVSAVSEGGYLTYDEDKKLFVSDLSFDYLIDSGSVPTGSKVFFVTNDLLLQKLLSLPDYRNKVLVTLGKKMGKKDEREKLADLIVLENKQLEHADVNKIIIDNLNRVKSVFKSPTLNVTVLKDDTGRLLFDVSMRSLSGISVKKIKVFFREAIDYVNGGVYVDGNKVCVYESSAEETEVTEIEFKCDLDLFDFPIRQFTPRFTEKKFNQKLFDMSEKKVRFILVGADGFRFSNIDKIKIKANNLFNEKSIKDIEYIMFDHERFDTLDRITLEPQEFVAANTKFYLSGDEIVLPSGFHTFSENVVIPRNTKLTIQSGANINLINDASFISYSPVIAKGTKTNKIYVRGEADGKGENFGVLDNDGVSEFEFVEFHGGGESTVNGAFFSGMLAIHHADSIIKYCKFENAAGDDALNIKYASSTVAHNSFVANSADAIDYDFSNGVIEYNKFIDNGNDSIDTSGSPVLIQFNEIINSGDKCISSGEKSTSVIFNNILHGCYIGIEVKDLSEPTIINNVIVHNDIGINEYQKKEIFGGGKGRVYNTIIWDNKESIILDKVSTIEVYNSDVESGYDGKGNFDKEPVFLEGFTNSEKDAIIKFKTGGNGDILKEVLGVDLDEVPVGLVYSFK